MKTLNKPILVQDSVKEAIDWLESEYPKGIDLIYIDYRDSYEDMSKLQNLLKNGDDDNNFEWMADAQYETIKYVFNEYKDHLNKDSLSDLDTVDSLTDEVEEAMKDWLFEHDTSTPIKDLLKNTRDQLCYIETIDYSDDDKKNWNALKRKYGKTEEQKKEIDYVINEQFYGAPVSFYFYASPSQIYNAIYDNNDKYIVIKRAYFSTIDRIQGSNWLGEKACFDLVLSKENFVENFFIDSAKGNGYSWKEIAGQTGYQEAGVNSSKTQPRGALKIKTEITEAQKREARLQKAWDDSRHTKCVLGDMNYTRHVGPQGYSNNYPCGNKCEFCGTFWID